MLSVRRSTEKRPAVSNMIITPLSVVDCIALRVRNEGLHCWTSTHMETRVAISNQNDGTSENDATEECLICVSPRLSYTHA